jgi:uncharacterized damage-inducible protein DinB
MAHALQPDHALFARDAAMRAMHNEQKVTRAVIEAIPLDKGDYRPDGIGKSALDLAWHVVTAEHRFMDSVVNGAFDLTPTARPADVKTSADIAAWYGETYRQDEARVNALAADSLARVVDFRGRFQMPAVMFLDVGLRHSIHHRGQLSTYLRPMGAKVPAIYGESYDTAQAKIAR